MEHGNNIKNQKINVQVYEHFSIEITINENGDGYNFKTPKGFGGRHYYSFCNDVDQSLQEQYPTIHNELYANRRFN